jgi:hypothetical protein
VVGARHVAVLVDLEDVAQLLVDDETADDAVRVVLKAADRLGVVLLGDQLGARRVVGQLLERQLVVEGERVIHVEADHADVAHAQVAIHIDAPRRLDVPLAGVQVGGRRWIALQIR